MQLDKKVVAITGGARGIGLAIAQRYLAEGASVVVADIDAKAIEDALTTLQQDASAERVMGVVLNVCDQGSIDAMVESVTERFGGIDILYNNVGVAVGAGHRDARIEQIEAEDFSFLVDVNLRGMVLTCKHVLPVMRAAGRGVVINISSLAALKPYPLVGYKTTKAGVIAFTQQVAANYARYGIRANVILPGLMETPMAVEGQVGRKTRKEIVAERDAQVPLGKKMGSAWDVANAALFLASDLAQYITGAVLPVDGGLSVT